MGELFVDLSRFGSGLPFVGDRLNALQNARQEEYGASWVLLGLRWRRTPVGFAFGYMHVDRKGLTPPSLDDIGSGAFDASGFARYRIQENAFLFGPVLADDTSLCELLGWACSVWWRRFSLAYRTLALVQVAFVNRAGIPTELTQFRDPTLRGNVGTAVDVGLYAQGGLSLQISNSISIAGLFDVGLPRVIQRLAATSEGNFRYDGRFVSGASISLGTSL
jgi:hypothetical protein